METFIFKFLALIYIPVTVGLFVSKKSYKKIFLDYSENNIAIFWGGLLSLIFGLILISLKNYLIGPNSIIIILLGYVSIFEGVVALVLPDFFRSIIKSIVANDKYYKISCWFSLFFSLIFIILGYVI